MKRKMIWLLLLVLLFAPGGALAVDLSPLEQFQTDAKRTATEPEAESGQPDAPVIESEPTPTQTRKPRPTVPPDPDAPYFTAMIDGEPYEFNGALTGIVSPQTRLITMSFETLTPSGLDWYLIRLTIPADARQDEAFNLDNQMGLEVYNRLKDIHYSVGQKIGDAYADLRLTRVNDSWSVYEGTLDALLYQEDKWDAPPIEIEGATFRVHVELEPEPTFTPAPYNPAPYNPDSWRYIQPFGFQLY